MYNSLNNFQIVTLVYYLIMIVLTIYMLYYTRQNNTNMLKLKKIKLGIKP